MAVRTPSTTEPRAPLPHPRWRLPMIGDLLTTDPLEPTQMSMRDAQALGPIFERRS
ncbi:hypothetical protein [Nocardia sp. bgisy134]|uniref:hypothetical protein n=1 Tax=unclassified Nocardia TaxID=2637762 RepID=UPI003D705CCF